MLWFRVRETQRVSVQFRTSSLSLQWSLSHIHVLHHSKNTESQKLDPDHRRSLQRSHQSLLRHPVVRRSPAGRSLGVLADTPRSPQAVSFSRPVDSWDWDLLRELLGVLEAEERVEPALLAREMGRGTGVTGGESSSTLSWVGEDEVDEFSCFLEDEELSSTLRTR